MIKKEITKDNKYIEFILNDLPSDVYNLKDKMRTHVRNLGSMDFDTYKKMEIATHYTDVLSFWTHLNYSPEKIYEFLSQRNKSDVIEVIAANQYIYINERKEIYDFFKEAFEKNRDYYENALIYILSNHNIAEITYEFLEDKNENKKLLEFRKQENKEIFLDLLEIGQRKGYLRNIDKDLLITKNEEYTKILNDIGIKEKEVFDIDFLLSLKRSRDSDGQMGTYLQTTLDSFFEQYKTYQDFLDKNSEKIIEVQTKTKSNISAFHIFTIIMELKTENFKTEQKEIIKNWLDDETVQKKIASLSEQQLLNAFKLHPEIFTEELFNKDYLNRNNKIEELFNQIERNKVANKEINVYMDDNMFNVDYRGYSDESGYLKSMSVLFDLDLNKNILSSVKYLEKSCSALNQRVTELISKDYLEKIEESISDERQKNEIKIIYHGVKQLTSNMFNRYIHKLLVKELKENKEIKNIYLDEKNQELRLDFLYSVKGRNVETDVLNGLKEYKEIMSKCDDGSENYKKIREKDNEYMNIYLNKLIEKKLVKGNYTEFKMYNKIKLINQIVELTGIDDIYNNEKFLFNEEVKPILQTKNGKSTNKQLYNYPTYIELILNSSKDVIKKVINENFVKKEKEFYKENKKNYSRDSHHLMTYVLNGKDKVALEVIEVLIENPKIYKELCLDDKKTLKLLEASGDKYIANTVKVMKELTSIEKAFKKKEKPTDENSVVKKANKI